MSNKCDFCDKESKIRYWCKCGEYHQECADHIRDYNEHKSPDRGYWEDL